MQNLARDCNCKVVVSRLFHQLRARDVRDGAAFETALKVYRIYHPEHSPSRARDQVAEWLGADD